MTKLQHDYGLGLPSYASPLEKQAVLPLLLPLGGLALKGIMAAMAAKGIYDIGTKDLPGLVKNVGQGNWRGALGNVASGVGNALFAVPAVGQLGRGLSMAAKGGKLLTLGKGMNMAAVGGSRVAQMAYRGANAFNRGAQTFMRSGVGQRILPAAQGAGKMLAHGPRWIMQPKGMGDMAKFMGTSLGVGAVGNWASQGEQPMMRPGNVLYPMMQQPGMMRQLGNYVRNMPATAPAQY